MTKKERLEAIMAHYADGKTSVMASKLGVADSTISTWLKRDTYDLELLFAKCENISAEWLITGEGDMIKSNINEDVIFFREQIRRKDREIDALYERIEELKKDIIQQGSVVAV